MLNMNGFFNIKMTKEQKYWFFKVVHSLESKDLDYIWDKNYTTITILNKEKASKILQELGCPLKK